MSGQVELEALYRTVPVGLCVLDTALRFVRVNDRMAAINGLPADAHLGRTVREVVPQLADKVEPLVHHVLATGEPVRDVSITGETAARPGVRCTWRGSWFPLYDEGGRVAGVQVVADEVAGRRRALPRTERAGEAHFLAVLTHAPVMLAHVDPALRYQWILNPPPGVEATVLGRRADELWEGPGIDALVRLKQQALDSGVQERARIAFEGTDGPCWYDVIVTPVRDGAGRTTHLVTAAVDATRHQHTEDALHALTETLDERVDARTRRVHELASALTLTEQTVRRRVAQVLHDDLQQELYAAQLPLQMLRQELEQGGHPALRVFALRAYDHLGAALDTARRLMVDLSPPVLRGEGLHEALQWLAGQMETRFGLHVELDGAGDVAVTAADMRVLLFQTVRELLYNVVRHARTDQVRVGLTETTTDLVIEIEAAGEGTDRAALAQALLDRVGLGLRHARERLALFGGRMTFAEGAGEGTVITVTIPLDCVGAPSYAEELR